MDNTEIVLHCPGGGQFHFDLLTGLDLLSIFIIEGNIHGLDVHICILAQDLGSLLLYLGSLLIVQLDGLDFHVSAFVEGICRGLYAHTCAVCFELISCILVGLNKVDADTAVAEDLGFDGSLLILCSVVDVDIAFFVSDGTDFFNLVVANGCILIAIAFDCRQVVLGNGACRKVIDCVIGCELIAQIKVEAASRDFCLSFGGNADVGKTTQLEACTGPVNVRIENLGLVIVLDVNDLCLLRSAHLCIDIDLYRNLRFDFFSVLIIERHIVSLDSVRAALGLEGCDHLEELRRVGHLFDLHGDVCIEGFFVCYNSDLFRPESDRVVFLFVCSCRLFCRTVGSSLCAFFALTGLCGVGTVFGSFVCFCRIRLCCRGGILLYGCLVFLLLLAGISLVFVLCRCFGVLFGLVLSGFLHRLFRIRRVFRFFLLERVGFLLFFYRLLFRGLSLLFFFCIRSRGVLLLNLFLCSSLGRYARCRSVRSFRSLDSYRDDQRSDHQYRHKECQHSGCSSSFFILSVFIHNNPPTTHNNLLSCLSWNIYASLYYACPLHSRKKERQDVLLNQPPNVFLHQNA